jgi:hypothetical protein
MRGDDGFREFVLVSTPALSRFAYLLTGDHHLAEDLLQSALANILGWSQSGEPVVAAYLPNDRGSTVNRAHLTTYGAVRTVEILRLRTGKGPRLLVRGPDDTLMSIDLASDIITSGKVRPGHPPSAWPTVAAIGTVVVQPRDSSSRRSSADAADVVDQRCIRSLSRLHHQPPRT